VCGRGPSGFRLRIQRVIGSCDRVSRKDCDLVKARTDTGIATRKPCEINRGKGCTPEVVGVNPEEEGNHRPRGIADTLIDAVIPTYPGKRLVVIVWENSLKRYGTCSNAVYRVVLSEQLDSHAPERCAMTDSSHRSA
jgi:hypothetical protein